MRPPLPSAPPGQNELPLAALGPPDSAGKWVGGARRDVKEVGMGDPPLCSQPPPSAKPAARSERGMSLVEGRPQAGLEGRPGGGWGNVSLPRLA